MTKENWLFWVQFYSINQKGINQFVCERRVYFNFRYEWRKKIEADCPFNK